MDVSAEFRREIAAATPALDRLAMLVAAHALGGLDPEVPLAELDRMADAFDGDSIDELCRYVSDDLGFGANAENYYDPGNSFLPTVLRRRKGIPLTLAIVTIEIGRRRNIGAVGVGMPGEFLLRGADDPTRWWSLFRGPEPMSRPAVEYLFESIHGDVPLQDSYLDEASTLSMIERMLANLAGIYQRANDLASLGWTSQLLAAMPDAGADRQRFAGAVAERRGRYWEAADFWDAAGALDPDNLARSQMIASRLRARSN